MTRKTALVTGCSEGGIGFAIAAEFQARGLHVFATARSPAKVESLASLPHVTVLALDVTSEESIDAAVAAVVKETGGALDFLVNNAGYKVIMPMLDLDMEQVKQMYDVNVFGVIAVTKAFAPLAIKAKGTIANLASIAGLMAPPYMGVYAGSKAACEFISEALRRELKPFGVKVATVITGAVETNIFNNGPAQGLPLDSRYKRFEKEISQRMSGKDQEGRLGKRKDFARGLVDDLSQGASGRVYRGNMSMLMKIVTATCRLQLRTNLQSSGQVSTVSKAE